MVSIQYAFTGGEKAVASQVNKNFNDCADAINQNASDISDLQSDVAGVVQADGSVDFTAVQKYARSTITGATNATPIVITAVSHDYKTGDSTYIDGVIGNTAANGLWTVTKVSDNTYSLDNSVGNGTYTSGGYAYRCPVNLGDLVSKAYVDNQISINDEIIELGSLSNTSEQLTANRFHTATFTDTTTTTTTVTMSTATSGILQVESLEFTTTRTTSPKISGVQKWDYSTTQPTWSTTATNLVTVYCHDGSTYNGNYRQIGV